MEKRLITCSRGHSYEKSKEQSVCPKCWPRFYKDKGQSDLPKLGAPALRALLNTKITTLKDLTKFTEKEILELHGIGPSSIPQLRKALSVQGLSFKKFE